MKQKIDFINGEARKSLLKMVMPLFLAMVLMPAYTRSIASGLATCWARVAMRGCAGGKSRTPAETSIEPVAPPKTMIILLDQLKEVSL